jgi:TP901 family phage tail tape measure protein
MVPTTSYDIIARDKASRAFLGVADSAEEMAATVKKSFESQEATVRRANSRLMADLKAQEASLVKAQTAAEKYGKATAAISKHGATLDKVAGGLAKVGILAGIGFGAAVTSAANFDEAMSGVEATGADAAGNMDALRKAAIKAGADTKYSATEAAQGMQDMLKAGVSAEDVLGGGLTGALNLAAAGQLSVADASGDAAVAMTDFHLKGRDMSHIADVMAAAAGKAQGEVSDMAVALKYVGPIAGSMGVSLEQTAGSIALLAQNGILADQAGTSLRGILSSLTSPSTKAASEMQSLGINVYDAQGKFVGFQGVAGQLHKALHGLTNEERDHALGVLFGNQQLTAARVLYNAGAKGVENWTRKVNDSGYAAQVAHTKMDNLKGDLEQLRGSFETALIGAGEGQQGLLRGGVQDLTKLVNAYNGLSQAAKTNVTRAVGALAVLALGGAATVKILKGVAAVKMSLIDLGITGRNTGAKVAEGAALGEAGMSRMRKAAGLATAAFIGVQTAGQIADAIIGDYSVSADEASAAVEDLANSSRRAGGALGSIFRETKATGDFTGATSDINGLGSALDRVFNRTGYQKVNDWITGVGSHIGLAKGQFGILKDQFGELDTAVAGLASSGSADKAAQAFGKIADEAARDHVSTQQLLSLFPQYQAALHKQAADLGVTNLTAKQYAEWMGGRIPAAIRSASHASASHSTATKDDTQAVAMATAKLKANKKALDDQRKELIAAGNAAISTSNDEIAWRQSIADATKAVKENKHTLDLHTQAGRDNRTALNNLASSTLTYVQDLIKNHASTKKLTGAVKEGRQAFIRVAEQMGATKKQADRMADAAGLVTKKYKAIPKRVSTQITQPGMKQAQRDAENLIRTVKNADGTTATIRYNVDVGGVEVHFSGKGASKMVAQSRAGGGPIHGPGGPRDDRVPVMASNGEFVHQTDAVNYYGMDVMHAINRRQIPKAALHRANGGPVDMRMIVGAPAYGAMLNRYMQEAQSYASRQAGAKAKEFMSQYGGGAVPLGGSGLVRWHGGTFTENFARHLMRAYAMARFNVFQGGWNPGGVAASGSTHDKDAVDAGPATLAVRNALRASGIAAWIRTPAEGFIYHVHGVPLPGAGTPSPQAAWQAQDYLRGGNGLLGGGLVTKDGIYPLSENGRPELVVGRQAGRLRSGSRVYNANDTEQMLGGGITINVYGDVVDSDDFIRKVRVGLDRYDRKRGPVKMTRKAVK